MKKFYLHTKSLMLSRLRLYVPVLVLSIALSIAAASKSSLDSQSLQLWLTDHSNFTHLEVNQNISFDNLAHLVSQCTDDSLSCDAELMMSSLSTEQKYVLKKLYKSGERIATLTSHVEFLSQSLQDGFIPKRFKVKNNLPGNFAVNEERLKLVSIESIKDEKVNHENSLKSVKVIFVQYQSKLKEVFDDEIARLELKRVEKHVQKVKKKLQSKKSKKRARDQPKNAQTVANVTIVIDDDTPVQAHNSNTMNLPENAQTFFDVTFANDDDTTTQAHNSFSRILPENADFNNVTIAGDDDVPVQAHKSKRRFKRRYLQPQPKKIRKRKSRVVLNEDIIVEATMKWNDVVKNICDEPVTETEARLLGKGQKFCPVELDPPIVRMQNEFNRFFRMLRIRWNFDGQEDQRTEMEKEFYEPSSWEPPKACKEIETLIQIVQEKFDKWKPPRHIRDNLTKVERKALAKIQNENNITYKWEDKGPSFTKMKTDQYLQAGEKELENEKFYMRTDEDPSDDVKRKCDSLVKDMLIRGEIPETVAKFLLSGTKKVSNFYHLLKTHKIPPKVESPVEWLPIKGNYFWYRGSNREASQFCWLFFATRNERVTQFSPRHKACPSNY